MAIGKEKSGRRASKDQRDIPKFWVEAYRKAQVSPEGRYCLNPQDPLDERVYVDYSDPEPLLSLLATFVKHGSFADPFDASVFQLVVRSDFEERRASGVSYQRAVVEISERYHCSTSTIERLLGQRQKVTPIDGD